MNNPKRLELFSIKMGKILVPDAKWMIKNSKLTMLALLVDGYLKFVGLAGLCWAVLFDHILIYKAAILGLICWYTINKTCFYLMTRSSRRYTKQRAQEIEIELSEQELQNKIK